MNILVLGGLGFIGHHLIKKLVDDGHNVKYTSSKTFSALHYKRQEYMGIDDADIHILNHFDVIIDCCGNANAHKAKDDPISLIDQQLTIPIQYINRENQAQYIYLSSSMVYGDFDGTPNEDAPLNPIEPYGIIKRTAEQMIPFYSKTYTIIRPSAVYGTRDKIERVISKFIAASLINEDLEVRGNQMLDFTLVDDLVDGIELCVGNPKAYGQTFNMTRGVGRSLFEAAHIINKETQSKSGIVIENHDPLYPNRGALDITKARNILGYNPTTDLEEGIKKYIAQWK